MLHTEGCSVDAAPLLRVREEPDRAYTTLCKRLDAALAEVDREDKP